jgi:hypothetical protein
MGAILMNDLKIIGDELVHPDTPKRELDYKKRYYTLVRELGVLEAEMCGRCPIVVSCCNGCNMLKKKINLIKKETLEAKELWQTSTKP